MRHFIAVWVGNGTRQDDAANCHARSKSAIRNPQSEIAIILSLCVLAVLAACGVCRAAEPSFDFEADAPGKAAAGWEGQGVVTEKGTISGRRSLYLAGTRDNDVAVTPPLPAQAGGKYGLTYRLRLAVKAGDLHIQFRCLDARQQALRPEWLYPIIETRSAPVANPMLATRQVTLDGVEKETAFVRIVFKWYGTPSGEAWLDDLSWVPLTDKPELRNTLPLDLRAQCNMGFRDEKEGDGTGGWTDQGGNDLRGLKPGRIAMEGLPLLLLDPAANQGRSCIVLGGSAHPGFPQRVSVPVGRKADRLFALHNSAWTGLAPDGPVVTWTFHYAAGGTAETTLVAGQDMNDWWIGGNTANSVVAVTTSNAEHTPVCLNLAEIPNPKPDQRIESIDIASAGRPMYGLVAVTLADGAPFLPWLKLQSEVEMRKATERWFACPLPWGAPEVPSPTNVSWLLEKPAGKHGAVRARDGHFFFEDGTRARFLATTCGWSGWVVSHEDAERMAAYLARMGVNLLRIYPYGIIKGDDPRTFTLDAEKVEKLDYLLSQLRQRGIYVYWYTSIMQLVLSPTARSLYRCVAATSPAPGLFDPEWMGAEERYWRLVLTHPNPYTGKSLAEDPMLAFLVLTNENELFPRVFDSREPMPAPFRAELQELWNRWLVERYHDRAGLAAAWEGMKAAPPLSAAEDPARGTVPLPERGDNGRIYDFRRFCIAAQGEFARRITASLRAMGVRCPIQHTNHIYTPEGIALMAQADFSNAHVYGPYQDGWVYTVSNSSMLRDANPFHGSIHTFPGAGLYGKLAGKPFVYGEWNVGYPNDFRGGGVLQGFTYGLLQDWDCVNYFCFFANPAAWAPDKPAVATSLESAFDPARVGLFPAIALMFHRGDVAPAVRQVTQRFTSADIERLEQEKGYPAQVTHLTRDLAWLPFVHRFALSPGESAGAGPVIQGTGEELAAGVRKLETEDAAAGLADAKGMVLRSDTRQLGADFGRGVLSIDTPRTQAVSGHLDAAASAATSGLEIRGASTYCSVILSSLDGEPVARSRRVLLTVIGDACNSDEVAVIDRAELANVPKQGRFHPSRSTINAGRAGKKPTVAEPVAVSIRLRRAPGAPALSCKRLDPGGQATGAVPSRFRAPWLELKLDGRERAIYYLLAAGRE